MLVTKCHANRATWKLEATEVTREVQGEDILRIIEDRRNSRGHEFCSLWRDIALTPDVHRRTTDGRTTSGRIRTLRRIIRIELQGLCETVTVDVAELGVRTRHATSLVVSVVTPALADVAFKATQDLVAGVVGVYDTRTNFQHTTTYECSAVISNAVIVSVDDRGRIPIQRISTSIGTIEYAVRAWRSRVIRVQVCRSLALTHTNVVCVVTRKYSLRIAGQERVAVKRERHGLEDRRCSELLRNFRRREMPAAVNRDFFTDVVVTECRRLVTRLRQLDVVDRRVIVKVVVDRIRRVERTYGAVLIEDNTEAVRRE